MNPIAQGLALGYSAQKIIGFLSKAFPSLTPKIRQAQRNGHTAEQVLGFLSKTMDNEVPKGVSQQEVLKATDKNQEMLTKHGLAALGGSAATYALSRAVPRIAQGLLPGAGQPQPAAPNPNPVPLQPGVAQQTQQMPGAQNIQPNVLQNVQPNQTQQPPVFPVAGNITQPAQPQQPKVNFTQLLTKHNAKEKVDDLIKSGNGAEIVAGYLKKFFPQSVKDMEKEAADTIENVIGRYAEENQAAPQEQTSMESEVQKLDVPKETPEVKRDPRYFGRVEDLGEKKLFHQTTKKAREGIEKEGFKLGSEETKSDPELPSGVYLKPSDIKISLPGDEQIQVHAQLGKTAHFKDRKDYVKFLSKNSPEFKIPYLKLLEKSKELEDYFDFYEKNNEVDYDEDKVNKLEDEIKNLGNISRKAATDYFKNNNINSLHIERDEGGSGLHGDKVETYITLNPNQAKINKGSTVSSPQGVGEVKEIRGDKALVDIDGKIHKVDIEDLEQEPEDIIQTVQELLKIPEVDRSSVVSLFTYDPSDNEMYIQFHNGETYKYLDVDPEKVYAVANKMGIPITEGKNIFGAWSPEDKQSLGATLIKEIINDPKYKKTKKGEEPNPNYRQLDTLYDYWEKLRKKPKRKK